MREETVVDPVYDPKSFEAAWQQRWEQDGVYSADARAGLPPRFIVDMFPYPSGDSMHVGHPRGYVGTDVYSRLKRMQGYRVLHPFGWDAFGLPAEETAIANREYPADTVGRNISRFKSQLRRLGLSYDWTREINTTDPKFYRHTQRIFLELFRRGLAYYALSTVNWCPALGTVLANEDIVDGRSERGGHPVFQQPMRQWTLRITAYASRLVDDLELLPSWPDKVKNAQRSWIGRSQGYDVAFKTTAGITIEVFTTRIETLAGVTFLAVSPEAALLRELLAFVSNAAAVNAYIEHTRTRTDRDRQVTRDKTGRALDGVEAVNPVTGARIPIVVADYVLASYGSGAVMGVPAHDERDRELAQAMSLPVVVAVNEERLVNSGAYTGITVDQARQRLAVDLAARATTQFKMRDWVFSRQRFWGEPFPIVWVCGYENYRRFEQGPVAEWLPEVPVTYEDSGSVFHAVPIIPAHLDSARLPVVEAYQPTGLPSGPLAGIPDWVNVAIDPRTGAIAQPGASPGSIPAVRETGTMPQWAGSSWYWLRYMDPGNPDRPFSAESAELWGPVNVYAGADHAVAHLIYARFWHKVLFDAGLVHFVEPFERLEFLGYVLASDGTKISKRKGNSRNPDEVIDQVGADAFRMYEMALGPFEKAVPWNGDNLIGMRRFLDRVWRLSARTLAEKVAGSHPDVAPKLHRTIEKITSDIEHFKFNTAVSAAIIFLNDCGDLAISRDDLGAYIRLLAPFAPHLAEEIWAKLGCPYSIHHAAWPIADTTLLQTSAVTLPIQVNGKKRAEISVPLDADEESIRGMVMSHPAVARWVASSPVKRFVYVHGRIISISV